MLTVGVLFFEAVGNLLSDKGAEKLQALKKDLDNVKNNVQENISELMSTIVSLEGG